MADPNPEHLRRAGDHLATASELADGDAADRLGGLADQCASLAERSRGPDHGRLARILTALSDLEPALHGDAAEHVREAREALTTYREDVEGV